MSTVRKHLYWWVVIATAVAAQQSFSLTAQDENRIVERAARARASAARYEAMLDSLERKLGKALDQERQAKAELDEANARKDVLSAHDAEIAEKSLDFANKKVNKLAGKIDEITKKLEKARIKVQETDWKENKIKSQRVYESISKRLASAKKNLKFFTRRVGEVELAERETRAEAAAKNRLATIAYSKWDRKINAWQAQAAEKKANTLVGELKYYRDKVAKTKMELSELQKEFAEAEKDYSQYLDGPVTGE